MKIMDILVRDAVDPRPRCRASKRDVLARDGRARWPAPSRGSTRRACSRCCVEREALQSTGIGEGVAIPHGKLRGPRPPARDLRPQPAGRRLRLDRRPADPPLLPARRAGALRRPAPEGAGAHLALLPRRRASASGSSRRRLGGRLPRDRGGGRQVLSRWPARLATTDATARWSRCEGSGVLLLGPSGIGKSECALELVRRGHRLVADDVVRAAGHADGERLVGWSPELIRHHMEIRGLGHRSACPTSSAARRCATRCRDRARRAGSTNWRRGRELRARRPRAADARRSSASRCRRCCCRSHAGSIWRPWSRSASATAAARCAGVNAARRLDEARTRGGRRGEADVTSERGRRASCS